MDVIRFPCVSLGSSTVHLHNSQGGRCAYACSEAGFSSQNGDRSSGVDELDSAMRSLWAKGFHTKKNIDIEIFPVYGGKCL
jgi:hypothetical protein